MSLSRGTGLSLGTGPSVGTGLSTAGGLSADGNGLPNYGVALNGLSYDSITSPATGIANQFGLTGNFNTFTDPSSGLMYVGNISGLIEQLSFSDLTDISTGTLTTAATAENTNFTDIDIESSGSNIISNTNVDGNLRRSTLSTDFDITTNGAWSTVADLATVFTLTGTAITGVFVNNAGTSLWIATSAVIRQATMSTPFDYSTLVAVAGSISIAGLTNTQITMTPEEKYAIVPGSGGTTIDVIELTVPGDITGGSTAIATHNIGTLTGGLITITTGLVIDIFNLKFYATDRTDGVIYQFSWTG